MRLWVLKRRLAGLAVVGVVLAIIIGFGAWYFWPRANCTDGVKNGAEEDIDCGGACQKQCLGEIPVEAKLLWKRAFLSRAGFVDVGAMMENRNLRLGTRKFKYRFELYTRDDIFLGKVEGETYLLPEQKTFVFHPNIAVGERKPWRLDFSFNPVVWERMDGELPSDIEVLNPGFEPSPHPIVRARIFNRALFEERALEVVALLKDRDGNVFAASKTDLKNIASRTEAEAVFTWPTGLFPVSPNPEIEILYRRIPR